MQEKFYFNPGDTGFKVFGTKFGKIGVAICWDQWFPEAARAMALQGAEVRGRVVVVSGFVHVLWVGLGWVWLGFKRQLNQHRVRLASSHVVGRKHRRNGPLGKPGSGM